MKSFVISITFFAIIVTGIIVYQFVLEGKAKDIIELADKIETHVKNNDKDKYLNSTKKLSNEFNKIQEWIMLFEDHDNYLVMAQCIKSLEANNEELDKNMIYNELYKFRFLLKYSVDSLKPTIGNIF